MKLKKSVNAEVEKNYPRKKFLLKLYKIANNLKSGQDYTLQLGNKRIQVPKRAKFYIEYEQENDYEEVEFSIKWKKQQK